MVDWDFRKARWDAFKLGRKNGRYEQPYNDEDIDVRFKNDYKEGYRVGEAKLHALRAKAPNTQCEDD